MIKNALKTTVETWADYAVHGDMSWKKHVPTWHYEAGDREQHDLWKCYTSDLISLRQYTERLDDAQLKWIEKAKNLADIALLMEKQPGEVV